MVRTRQFAPRGNARRGMLTPAVAFALLVVLAALALVIDRLWLDAAVVEIRTCAETVALAAARELADDDLLIPEADASQRLKRAQLSAEFAATQNGVAGAAVTFDIAGGDLRFGRLIEIPEEDRSRFLETRAAPNAVIVHLARSRARGNPVALFLAGLTHQPAGDVAASATASIDNRVMGLRPFTGTPVPALPLAILWRDPAGKRDDTWQVQIEERTGTDAFSYDRERRAVLTNADGIPEITLRSMTSQGEAADSNVQLLDVGTSFQARDVLAQFQRGWSEEQLRGFGGELRFDAGSIEFTSFAVITGRPVAVLEQLIGQPRIWMLYDVLDPLGSSGLGRCGCGMPVAARIMSVRMLPDEQCELVLQPCVMTTRTAMLSAGASLSPYLYKLQLTN